MENVQVASVEQATLVVGVLAMATDNNNGISGDSQVRNKTKTLELSSRSSVDRELTR